MQKTEFWYNLNKQPSCSSPLWFAENIQIAVKRFLARGLLRVRACMGICSTYWFNRKEHLLESKRVCMHVEWEEIKGGRLSICVFISVINDAC